MNISRTPLLSSLQWRWPFRTDKGNSAASTKFDELEDQCLFNCLDEAVVCLDPDFSVSFINSNFTRKLHWNASDVIGNHILNFVYKEDVELLKEGLCEVATDSDQWKSEIAFLDAEGVGRKMELELIRRKRSCTYTVFLKEIIPTELIEEQSRNKMFQMLENIPDGFFMVDKAWRLLYMNREAERIAQRDRRDIIGKRLWEEYPQMVGTYIHSKYIEAMETGNQIRFEGYLPQFDAWFETNLYPSLEGLAVYFRDVTENKKARESLRQYAEQLKQSNEELEQFAHIASHDLKEPLRMVSSFVHLLKQEYSGRLGEEADEFIHYISEGSARMQQMIGDLLLYSRSTRMSAERKTIALNDLVNHVLLALNSEIERTNAKIQVGDLPEVDGDWDQLTLLFQNLLQNSLKFREENVAPVIEISSEVMDKGNIICVVDNGIGLDVQYSKKIFQIFQRLHARDRYPGSGIGLAIAKKIVEKHGGRIWVESQKGKGARFYFSLPHSDEQKKVLGAKTYQFLFQHKSELLSFLSQ